MRELNIGSKRFTKVLVTDEPGQDGACHNYSIGRSVVAPPNEELTRKIFPADVFGRIKFQNGPVKEFGVNGCHQEDLLAIVIDRLKNFQSGDLACRENAIALTKIEEAMHWLNHRTNERIKRGVEGTTVK